MGMYQNQSVRKFRRGSGVSLLKINRALKLERPKPGDKEIWLHPTKGYRFRTYR